MTTEQGERPAGSAGPNRDWWVGRFAVSNEYGWYVGPTFATVRHAHHTVQLIFTVDAPVRVRVGAQRHWHRACAAVVPADVPHAYQGDGAAAILVYLPPESRAGRVAAVAAARAAALHRALEPAAHSNRRSRRSQLPPR